MWSLNTPASSSDVSNPLALSANHSDMELEAPRKQFIISQSGSLEQLT